MQSPIPQRLQSVLWSSNIQNLHIDSDKTYIIHQILSYGNMEDIQWLFTIYSREVIEQTFTSTPYKDYRKSRFYFIKDFVIGVVDSSLSESSYVKNTPRNIG